MTNHLKPEDMTKEQLVEAVATNILHWRKLPLPWWVRLFDASPDKRKKPITFVWQQNDEPVWDGIDPRKWNPIKDFDETIFVASKARLKRTEIAQCIIDNEHANDAARAICIAALSAIPLPTDAN